MSAQTRIRELHREQPHRNACVQNWPSTNRPSFAAANQVVTLTRVTNERGRLVAASQFRSVQSISVIYKYVMVQQRSVNKIYRKRLFSNINRVVNLWNSLPVRTDFTSLSKFSRSLNNDYLLKYRKATIVCNSNIV